MISLFGMAYIFAFQNHKHVLLKEHTSFLKHEKLGVLEPLFFSHSGMAKKDGFQNQKRSANDIFKPFRNTKKWPFQNPKQQPHSGRPWKKALQNEFFAKCSERNDYGGVPKCHALEHSRMGFPKPFRKRRNFKTKYQFSAKSKVTISDRYLLRLTKLCTFFW